MTLAKALKAANTSPSHKVSEPWRVRLKYWHPAIYLDVSPSGYGLYDCYMRVAPTTEFAKDLSALFVPGKYRLSITDAIATDWEVYEP